jgi:glycerol-3-phosphate responsive antiterminator
MNEQNLKLVKLKNASKKARTENELQEYIVDALKDLPYDLSTVEYVCNLIENGCVTNKKKMKLDKKKLAIQCLEAVFNDLKLSSSLVSKLEADIEYLHSLGRIKKIPVLKKMASFFLTIVSKL